MPACLPASPRSPTARPGAVRCSSPAAGSLTLRMTDVRREQPAAIRSTTSGCDSSSP
ncbi:hypothetical protein ACFQZ4_03765 [Catellatospora coxensis]